MLTAMIEGERDPAALAERTKGRMRRKIPELAQALEGHFDAHHAQLARSILHRLDLVESAGRQRPAGTRHGNKWLCAMLVEAAGSVWRMHGKHYLRPVRPAINAADGRAQVAGAGLNPATA